jgi:L-iditol 2-dehydrogenase
MKAMMLTGIREMEMKEVPDPVLKQPDDVMIRLLVLGICGSDIHYYTRGQIGSQVVKYPFTVGHECAGMVMETGPGVTHVAKGDIIAVEPAMWCGTCDQCLSGRHHTCRNLKFLGCPGQAEGSLSEYIVMPESSCYPLFGNLTPDHGAISEPLSIGIYAVKKAGEIDGLKTGILGFGPIGMSVMLAAKARKAGEIHVTDKIDARLKVATKEKANWTGNPLKDNIIERIRQKEPLGLDIVFECCGQQEAVDEAISILKPGGRLIIVGIPEFKEWTLNVDETRRREISIQFIRRQVDCVDESLEMMSNGTIDVSNMITHRFPFDNTKKAFDLVAAYRDGVMKAMIDFSPPTP